MNLCVVVVVVFCAGKKCRAIFGRKPQVKPVSAFPSTENRMVLLIIVVALYQIKWVCVSVSECARLSVVSVRCGTNLQDFNKRNRVRRSRRFEASGVLSELAVMNFDVTDQPINEKRADVLDSLFVAKVEAPDDFQDTLCEVLVFRDVTVKLWIFRISHDRLFL